ncbi:MAG: hypothetical protein JO112_19695, partial [Planctomycetes bacterium]|nr:hypothetical protein [Planctomycetota bacterium]
MNPERTLVPAGDHGTSIPQAVSWIHQVDAVLEYGVFGSITLLLLSSLVFMGGRYDWGWLAWSQCVFVGSAALTTLFWLLRLFLRPELGLVLSWSLLLPAAGGLIGALQLIELPPRVLEVCSPGLASTLPLGRSNGREDGTWKPWNRLSLAPERTTEGLRHLALYGLTFFLVIQNVRTLRAIRRFLFIIFALGGTLAFF